MSTVGPRLRLVRRLGVPLPGLTRKSTERKPYPPGQHGQSQSKAKLSVYGLQLREKQKLRFNYGISERQLRRYVTASFKSKGHSGHNLLRMLESRLDSVVFRAGFAPTIPSAKQLVSHGHILVNGKRVTIGSCLLKAGDEISLTPKGQNLPLVVSTIEHPTLIRPQWLACDTATKKAKLTALPDRDSFPIQIQETMLMEFYAQRN
jgi:small subunit ribosomal protein S4